MEFLFYAVLFNFRCAAFLFYQTQKEKKINQDIVMDMNQERLKLKMENGVYILEAEKKNYSY